MTTGGVKCDLRDAGSVEGKMCKVGIIVKETVIKANVLILSFSHSQQCYEHLLPSGPELHDSV